MSLKVKLNFSAHRCTGGFPVSKVKCEAMPSFYKKNFLIGNTSQGRSRVWHPPQSYVVLKFKCINLVHQSGASDKRKDRIECPTGNTSLSRNCLAVLCYVMLCYVLFCSKMLMSDNMADVDVR